MAIGDETMKIAVFASEMDPFIKTGGLADVIGSLPLELANFIDYIAVFIPLYRDIKANYQYLKEIPFEFSIKIGSLNHKGNLFYIPLNNKIEVFFIDNYHFFGIRTDLYVKDGKDYRDNLQRFVFFCKGSLEALMYLSQQSHQPFDILHTHDWQTALINIYSREMDYFVQTNPLRVYTIHNLNYQGKFPQSQFNFLGINRSYFTPDKLEFWGKINLMKAGILYSDILTTVSPTYAKEIQTEKFGAGLNTFIKKREANLHGILNGVDYSQWNPKTDPFIAQNYSASDLNGKSICKSALQSSFALSPGSKPLLAVISRLDWQKGMELILEVLPYFLKNELAQFILVGSGDPKLEKEFSKFALQNRGNVGVKIAFNNTLAHQVEAGADIFLMPSRYEPCGLNDKYSLKYGTVPIVHKTGGLADSVIDYIKDPQKGTGFCFQEYNSKSFQEAIKSALKVFQSLPEWRQLMKRGMDLDFSWRKASKQYLEIYKQQMINNG